MSSSSGEDQSPATRHRSSKPSRAQPSGAVSDQDLPQHDPDPPYYREVALSDIPSQYAEEVDTFRRILSLPDPRESMPRSSTSVMGLDDEKGRQELRPRGPSSILPLSSVIKDAFDKFQHDFKAADLPEGKYVKPPPSTSKWYRVGQPCFQDKIQELNTDFAKICITPKPSGAPMGKAPLPVLKELEHQARQNISTLNFTTAFAKTSSFCNASQEKCQHSIKSTVKKIKSQIQKVANPEKAAKRGYEEVAEYMDFWNKTLLIQHRALTCLSKSLAHILQRELYSMANTSLLGREAEVTLLHPQLGETRCQELRNSSFWDPSLFESQLGEDFLLKKGAYAYPPTALHKVIQKIKQCHCLIIVIAPGWPGMPWFWDLVQLLTEIPLQLPVSTTLLKQSHKYVFHNNPQQLNLHAWCLGADNSKNKASLWRWQRELLLLSGHQQGPCTSQNGPYLKNGAEKIRWISPLHL